MASTPVFVHETMQEMERAFSKYGNTGIARMIPDLDKEYSPKHSVSRISIPVIVEHSSLLLSQLPSAMVQSILKNTLVEDVVSKKVKLEDWHKIPRRSPAKDEPGIYVNYFTQADGTGLSVDEYEEYVECILAVLKAEQVNRNGTLYDPAPDVDRYFNNQTKSKNTTSLVDEARKTIKVDSKGNSTIDIDEFEDAQIKIIAAARATGAKEIRFFGEVGWFINVDDRCRTHHSFQGSAIMFRLTMCVVGALFPQYTFSMTSYCLFRVVVWNHAEIGESIGSHLVSSYGKYGGFNFTTAGISVSTAVATEPLFWKNMCTQYKDMLAYSEDQIQLDIARFKSTREEAQKRLDLIVKRQKLEEMDNELNALEHELVDRNDEFLATVRRARRRVDALKATNESKETEAANCWEHLDTLAKGLELKAVADMRIPRYVSQAPASSALQSAQVTPRKG